MEELNAVENVLLSVAWAAVGGIAVVALVWFVRALKPQDGPRIVSKHWTFDVHETPITLLSPERRYELWRKELTAWTDEDGTQVGLDALLERWRGVPHEKPQPKLVAGMDVGDPKGAVTVIRVGEKFNYVAPTKEDLDRMSNGGDGARMRFFEHNRASAMRQVLEDEVKAAKFREAFAGAEKAGESLTLNDLKFKAFTVNCAGSPPKTFRSGEWVRMTSGRGVAAFGPDNLFKISDCLDSTCGVRLIGRDGGVAAGWHEIEHALPRTGEWWISAETGGTTAYQVDSHHDHGWLERQALKGEIVPVNFGRGEGAKS